MTLSAEMSDALFNQGARCGHLEGKDRCGVYVSGEEFEASSVATQAQTLPSSIHDNQWAAGYRYGYMLAAQGNALPKEVQTALLPSEVQ